ncbi:VWA domain-containing protein [candidate division KSB1 bacterium]|nr:VWA domain-containing protein [candidate division KSB1 bacterium]
MKLQGKSFKGILAFGLSLLLALFTILPLLGFWAAPDTLGEIIKPIGPLRLLVFYLSLGMLAIITWIIANEATLRLASDAAATLSHGLAFFAKAVSLFVVSLVVILQILILLGTFIVYWGNLLFGIDFGNVRFFYENQVLLILSHFVIPAVILFLFYARTQRRKILARFGNLKLIENLSAITNRRAQLLKLAMLTVALFYLIVAWARPQLGTKLELVKREGVDIMVALDVSYSMLAEDITPNRLEKAKHEIANLIDKLEGDRIGLIAFAGVPFIQCPLTLDYGAAKLFLDIMSPDLIPEPGTALDQAIQEGAKAFEQSERQYKVLIIITDGEGHEGDPLEAAKKAASQGVVIFTVGLGTPSGVPIPQYDSQGGLTGFKKDRQGNEVVTKLDEITLEKIALETNGGYYRASAGEMELDKIYEAISKMERKELASKKFTQYEDRFQYILILALFLLIIEGFIPERKSVRHSSH